MSDYILPPPREVSKLTTSTSPYSPPERRSDLKWLAIDLDQTLSESAWSPDNPFAPPGEPIWRNVAKLRSAVEQGWKVTIHTSRSWAEYEIVESWLNHHDIPFKAIVCGKLLAAVYVDDKAIHESAKDWTTPKNQCVEGYENGIAEVIDFIDQGFDNRSLRRLLARLLGHEG